MSTTSLKVLSAQELVEEIPAILFIGVIVVDCEELLIVIGFRATLLLGWARSTRTCTTFAFYLTMFGAQGPWSSSVYSVPGQLDSVVLKTKSVSFRTHMPLKPDSIIPKTLLNRCHFLSGSPVRGALPFTLTIVLSAQLCFQGNLSM